MYNPLLIESGLATLVGFRNHNHKDYDVYKHIGVSDSGLYIDNTSHPLITVENIHACAEMFVNIDVRQYQTGTYEKDALVRDSDKIYQSLTDGNNTALTDTSKWKETNLLSYYLENVRKNAALKLIGEVISKLKLYEVAKTLLTDTQLYKGVGNSSQKVTKYGRFVGFKITPKHKDVSISLKWAGLQVDTLNPAFKLYVYHTSQDAPLKVFDLNINKVIDFTWKPVDVSLLGDGVFYIGYYENELTGQAIWKDHSFNGSCSSCNNIETHLFSQWSKFIEVQPFYVDNIWLNGTDLFNTEKAIDVNNTNYGLNLKFSVNCDVTGQILDNKMLFADALRKQITHDLVESMAYSLRDNQKKVRVSELAFAALDNTETKAKGLKSQLEDAIKAIQFDISGMSSVCMPCNQKSVTITSHFG